MEASTLNTAITAAAGLVTVAGGFVTWLLNERSKRVQEEYVRKELRYIELVKSLRGFYAVGETASLKEEFIAQVRLAWLYCPDEVIKRADGFLETVREGATCSDEEKVSALNSLLFAIRRDLFERRPIRTTKLNTGDFRHWRATDKANVEPSQAFPAVSGSSRAVASHQRD
jgi:hypothetical protein